MRLRLRMKLRLRMRLGLRLGMGLRLGFRFRLGLSYFFGWVVGVEWLDKSQIKLSQLPTKLKLKLKLSLAMSQLSWRGGLQEATLIWTLSQNSTFFLVTPTLGNTDFVCGAFISTLTPLKCNRTKSYFKCIVGNGVRIKYGLLLHEKIYIHFVNIKTQQYQFGL